MVIFEISSAYEKVYEVVLNGNNFHLKLQEILLGKGKYNNYYITKTRDIEEWKVRVLEIDLEKEDINKYLFGAHAREGMPHRHVNIRDKTLDEHYQKISVKQNFDFYLNLRDYYGKGKLNEIIYLYTRKNVSRNWLRVYFNLSASEVDFILKYLPCYYNYLGGKDG